jgi:hypothetical protein
MSPSHKVAYHALNLVQTPALDSVYCFTDELFRENPELTRAAGTDPRSSMFDEDHDDSARIDPIADLPLSRVNELLFQPPSRQQLRKSR